MVSEETGEHVDRDTDLVTGGVGSGLGGLMGEGRWVEVISDDVIGDGGASSMIPLLPSSASTSTSTSTTVES